jgi:hypothetical protein
MHRNRRLVCVGIRSEGYRGAYDSVQRFVRRWKAAKLAV